MEDWLIPLSAARDAIARDGGYSTVPMRHGSMRLVFAALKSPNVQSPHAQDELYIVRKGAGFVVKGSERRPCGEGDMIFVEAGAEHRFEDFTDPFEVWAVFWGPEGGEPGGAA